VPVSRLTGHVSGLHSFGPVLLKSYHTGYKFGVGPRNETHVPKFLPSSCRPPLLLSCGRLAWQHHGGGAAHPHPAGLRNDAPLCVAATVRRARPHPARPRPSLVDVSLTSMGNSSPPCCASSPCGICIVAHCPFSVWEEWGPRGSASAYHFLMPPLGLMFGWLLLGEHVELSDLLGIVPVGFSIYLVTRRGFPQRALLEPLFFRRLKGHCPDQVRCISRSRCPPP
jgi:hypothetical protein